MREPLGLGSIRLPGGGRALCAAAHPGWTRGEEAHGKEAVQPMVGRPNMRPRGIVVALVIFVALLVTAPVALAANATEDAYCEGCSALHQKQVPFTGLDVALVVAAGGALIAAGFGIRRLGRSDTA